MEDTIFNQIRRSICDAIDYEILSAKPTVTYMPDLRKLSIFFNDIIQSINEFNRCDIELSDTVHEVKEHISCSPEEDWERMVLHGIHKDDK